MRREGSADSFTIVDYQVLLNRRSSVFYTFSLFHLLLHPRRNSDLNF